jgi:RND family efflux transporter MFP subunit
MKNHRKVCCLLLPLLSTFAAAGCSQPSPSSGTPPLPEVLVTLPTVREVTDYEDFPGRAEAVDAIDIRARVTGYLDKMYCTEGADVKLDDLLFEIDPRPYQAELARANAALVQSEARRDRLEADFKRAVNLLPKAAIGREEYDRIAGDRLEAGAAVGVANANIDIAKLNLSFTRIKAPKSGRISRRYIDPGNLVKADDTVLTSLVSLDPIYAYFDLDERTALRLQKLIRDGKLNSPQDGNLPVRLGLANEEGFPRHGTTNFADNRIDPDTGTWRLRALFKNPTHVLAPGLFVRVRLPIGDPFPAILIPEQALGTDQGQKFVYVVKPDGVVDYRRVQVGRLHDGLRVISKGLDKDELIVVSGLQRIRQGTRVAPKKDEQENKKDDAERKMPED